MQIDFRFLITFPGGKPVLFNSSPSTRNLVYHRRNTSQPSPYKALSNPPHHPHLASRKSGSAEPKKNRIRFHQPLCPFMPTVCMPGSHPLAMFENVTSGRGAVCSSGSSWIRVGFRRGFREFWFRMLVVSLGSVCNILCAQRLTGGTTTGGATSA